jgi:hypothetical protein
VCFGIFTARLTLLECICFLSRLPQGDTKNYRFLHPQHYRIFGEDDLQETIGMIFNIEAQLNTHPIDLFGEETLTRYNIPKTAVQRGNTVRSEKRRPKAPLEYTGCLGNTFGAPSQVSAEGAHPPTLSGERPAGRGISQGPCNSERQALGNFVHLAFASTGLPWKFA